LQERFGNRRASAVVQEADEKVGDTDGAHSDPQGPSEWHMSRPGFGRALAGAAIAAELTHVLSVGIGAAQERSLRIEGRVLWIAAETMVVGPYTDSPTIRRLDLSQVDQDEYMRLTADESVAWPARPSEAANHPKQPVVKV
jgi:hypothetical protein